MPLRQILLKPIIECILVCCSSVRTYGKQILIRRTSGNENSFYGSLIICLNKYLLYIHMRIYICVCVYTSYLSMHAVQLCLI